MLETFRKIFELFERRERWELAGLLAVIIVMALLQTVGVASILPFMNLVANPDAIVENRWIYTVYTYGQFETHRAFLIFAGFAVLLIAAVSNAFTALTHWLIVRFIWRKRHHLAMRLLAKYLHQPYTFYLQRNTAGLAKNLLTEVGEAIGGAFMPGMKMLAHAIVTCFILALLLLVDPVLAVLSIFLLGGSYAVVYALVRRKQARLGLVRSRANGLRYKTASEALAGIKETKVLGREEEFLRRFAQPSYQYSYVNVSNATISEIPRYVLETLALGGILVAVLYVLNTHEDFGQAAAVMSLYAVAGYRLMPALQHIFNGMAKARFFAAAVDNLHSDLVLDDSTFEPPAEVEGLSFDSEIAVAGVCFKYPGSDQIVVRDVTLRIAKNTTVGFAGGTGSGKSTFVDILLGLLLPEVGCIRVDGVPLSDKNRRAWLAKLGYVPQEIYLCDDTITRNIAFGVPDEEIDRGAVQRAAEAAHLASFIADLPRSYETVVGERGVRLSGGQRQRIGIARALYHDPQVLIMDEATSALDGITEDAVMEAIRNLAGRKTLILVAHRLSTLRECDVVYLVQEGSIVDAGSYTDLMTSNPHFRAMAKTSRSDAVPA